MRLGLEGNLCRCTGYHNIVQVGPRRRVGVTVRPAATPGGTVIPAAFDYVRAESAEEAISLVGEHGDEAKFIAGGHSLLPMMKLRLAQPTVLIDIGRLSDLSYIRDGGDHIADRRADPPHGRRDVGAPARARAAARARRRPGRRPAGPSPRHDRRLDRPRRPGVRPARDHARARRHLRRPGPERHPRDRRRRLLPGRSSSRPSPPTRCSPRSACRRCNGAGWSFQKFNRRAQDWAIVGVAAWRGNGDSGVGARQHGLDARCSPPACRRRCRAGRRSRRPPSWPPRRPSRRPTSTPASSTATHLAKVLTRRALAGRHRLNRSVNAAGTRGF